jgi:hypothetical protein
MDKPCRKLHGRNNAVMYVAWVDLVGSRKYWPRNGALRKDAIEIWNELYELVKVEFDSVNDKVEIYGANDGFFLRDPDLIRLCRKLTVLYQKWFDAQKTTIRPDGGLPLLRGMIVTATDDAVRPATGCIKSWLFGPGFASSFKEESILSGGRLFLNKEHDKDMEKAHGTYFRWKDLSEWRINEKDRPRELYEIFWPIDEQGNAQKLLARLEYAKSLYDAAFKEWASLPSDSDRLTIYAQYEETLKMHIRACGRMAKLVPASADNLLSANEVFLGYNSSHPELTWGLTFATLFAYFLAEYSGQNLSSVFSRARAFLTTHRTSTGTWLDEFKKELDNRPTYENFKLWIQQQNHGFLA